GLGGAAAESQDAGVLGDLLAASAVAGRQGEVEPVADAQQRRPGRHGGRADHAAAACGALPVVQLRIQRRVQDEPRDGVDRRVRPDEGRLAALDRGQRPEHDLAGVLGAEDGLKPAHQRGRKPARVRDERTVGPLAGNLAAQLRHGGADEGGDIGARTQRRTNLGDLAGYLVRVDGVLGEPGTGRALTLGGADPVGVQVVALGGEPEVEAQLLGVLLPEQQTFANGIDDAVRLVQNGNGNARGLADLRVLADQDVKDDPVDLVVGPVEGDGADDIAALPVPVDTPLAL